MLVKFNLPFRGSSSVGYFKKITSAIFSLIIQPLAKYDVVSDNFAFLHLPKGSPKYLISLIQNESISVLAEEVLCGIKSEVQNVPFAIIFVTTKDVKKKAC